MEIRGLLWDDANVEHIARHNITPGEVEEIYSEKETLYTRVGRRRYQAIGQTAAGRYLTLFLDHLGRGHNYPVTAHGLMMESGCS